MVLKSESLVEGFFGVDPEEEITFWGKHDKTWGWIHAIDLANIYLRIAETEQEHQVPRSIINFPHLTS